MIAALPVRLMDGLAANYQINALPTYLPTDLDLDLEELTATDKFDIIAITESWLNTKDRDFLAEYNLLGYSIFIATEKTE